MTGRMATDPSYASGSGAYGLTQGRYDPEILAAAGISPGLFPEIVPSASVVGDWTQGPLPASACRRASS